MNKKIVSAVLCLILVVGCLTAVAACDKDGKEKLSIVYLGDSIGEAVAGPSPLEERDNYGYPGVIGQVNDYYYHNRAISGNQTKQMLAFINREDTNAAISASLIRTADVIHVSILGNDLLQADFGTMLYDREVKGESKTFNAAIKGAEENIAKIIVRLREMNPKAHIMFQNVYNPVYAESKLMETSVKEKLASVGIQPSDYRRLGNELLSRLDSIVPAYLAEHPDKKIHIIDAYAEFGRIFDEDPERGKRLIFVDGVHPSDEGHAVLANLIQNKLVALGLASEKDGVKNYKTLRCEQIDRLYSETDLDRAALKAAVQKASTFAEVSEVYFDGVRNYTAKCNSVNLPRNYAEDTYIFDYDREFYFDKITLDNVGFPDLVGKNLMDLGVFGPDCRFSFYDDGTFRTTVTIADKFIPIINALLGTLKFEELMAGKVMGDLDVEDIVREYCKNMFPGATVDDFSAALEVVKRSIGVEIIGADNLNGTEIWNSITKEGKLPENAVLRPGFGFEINSTYCVKKVKGADGEEWTAVYIGRFNPDTEPFLIFTVHEDGGISTVDVSMEILGLVLYGTEK